MELVHKIERSLAEQYKKLPHLPAGGQKWLAENAWWLVLIGVIFSLLGLIGIALALGLAAIGLGIAGASVAGSSGAAAGFALGGLFMIITIVTSALFLVQTVLMAMAISPLKKLHKKGWDLIFVVALLNAVTGIVIGILSANPLSLLSQLLWAALGAYFLFEIREYYLVKKAHPKTLEFKAVDKADA